MRIRLIPKRALFLLFLVLPLWTDGIAEDLAIRLPIDKRTLSNGLTVYMVRDPDVPMVSYQTWVRAGSVDEVPGKTGLAHFFEHLMFKGTRKHGPGEFFKRLESRGAEVNANTTRDYTMFYENITPDLLDEVIELEADRLRNLEISQDLMQTELQVILEERQLRVENSPSAKMMEAIWALSYQAHPYRWPILGDPRDLMGVTVQDLKSFYDRFYQPSNVALVIVGNFNPDHAFARIRREYGKIPETEAPKREIAPEPKGFGEKRLILYDEVGVPQFAMAYKITSALESDTHAIDVLSNILFEGTSSRAYRLLVENQHIASAISGVSFTPTFPGLLIISGTMRPRKKVDEAEALLGQLFNEIQDHPVSEKEIKTAVRQLTVDVVDSVQTPMGLGQLVGIVHSILGDGLKYSEDLSKYLHVTREDVRRVARQYLDPNQRVFVTLLPKSKGSGEKR